MRTLPFLALCAWLAACGGKEHTPDPPATFCPAGIGPTFSSIDQALLKPRCTACHSATLKGGLLDLSGDAYAAMVNIPAQNVAASAPPAGLLRVKPGDAAASLLWQKLANKDVSAQFGAGMPQDAPGTVCPAAVEAVRQWIAAGAARN